MYFPEKFWGHKNSYHHYPDNGHDKQTVMSAREARQNFALNTISNANFIFF